MDDLVQGLGLVLPKQQRKRPYVAPMVPHTQQAKRLAEALAMTPAAEYAAWIRGLGAIKAAVTLGVLSDDDGQAMFAAWSEAAGPQATAQNDDTRFDPSAMWVRWSPSTAPADALLGALYAAARDAALDVVRDQITTDGALDGKGLNAARYVSRHHARAFKALRTELGNSQ
ncbi:hypothetical protein [Denitromonas halophila]|uniref:Uncharacterized protein n=1 Tax=Denitromonas halophila TaxID=1629404 RepID=A0A557QJJ2_9RHOO|nr:hypothetical protein [Denitromonas halophila]TVO53075.1 hypothetical protein FHP91_14820 [Denitromonas halophila]